MKHETTERFSSGRVVSIFYFYFLFRVGWLLEVFLSISPLPLVIFSPSLLSQPFSSGTLCGKCYWVTWLNQQLDPDCLSFNRRDKRCDVVIPMFEQMWSGLFSLYYWKEKQWGVAIKNVIHLVIWMWGCNVQTNWCHWPNLELSLMSITTIVSLPLIAKIRKLVYFVTNL